MYRVCTAISGMLVYTTLYTVKPRELDQALCTSPAVDWPRVAATYVHKALDLNVVLFVG